MRYMCKHGMAVVTISLAYASPTGQQPSPWLMHVVIC